MVKKDEYDEFIAGIDEKLSKYKEDDLSPEQVASILGYPVTVRLLRRWRARGKNLSFMKVGTVVKYRKDHIRKKLIEGITIV